MLIPSPVTARFGSYSQLAPQPMPPWRGAPSTDAIYGAKTNTQPIDEPKNPIAANLIKNFGFADWYDRIHVTPRSIDLGSIVSTQTRTIVVWNAYAEQKTLTSITSPNAAGLTLTQPGGVPLLYNALQQVTYTLQATLDGEANLEATYTFSFGAEALDVEVFGSRITPWVWRPDWSQPMVERLQWETEVLTAYDGSEQRIRLREFPRRTFEFGFAAEGKLRRRLETSIYGWGARSWALPVWPDGERLTSTATSGASSITVTTTNRDYRVGGLVMLLADDGAYEVHEILSLAAGSLTIKSVLASTWTTGSCTVYPVRLAKLPDAHGFARFTHDAVYGIARMEATDNSAWTAATETTTHLGYPVLTERPNWVEDIGIEYERKVQTLDFGTGRRRYVDQSGVPNILQTHRWMLESKARIAAYRAWLYARAGRLNAIWVPTWTDDLIVASTVASAATTIDIEAIDYTKRISSSIHRKDIRIELTNGTVYYRRITGSQEISATIERISINSSLGVDVPAANFKTISFISLCRLDSDGVELAYFTGDIAEAANTMRAAGHGI